MDLACSVADREHPGLSLVGHGILLTLIRLLDPTPSMALTNWKVIIRAHSLLSQQILPDPNQADAMVGRNPSFDWLQNGPQLPVDLFHELFFLVLLF
jgi:hypothetical protein